MASDVQTYNRATAPAANTVLADTGALLPGVYEVRVEVGTDDSAAAGKYIEVQHRDSGNATTLHGKLCPAPAHDTYLVARMTIADGERIRCVSGPTAAVAATIWTTDIRVRPVS